MPLLLAAQASLAQTLDDQLGAALGNGCPGLSPVSGSGLSSLCATTLFLSEDAVTAGGNQTQSQGSTVSVVPRAVAARLEGTLGIVGGGASADGSIDLGGGFSAYGSIDGEVLNRDVTTNEDAYDSQIVGVSVGGDYLITDWAVAGMAFSYSSNNGDFDAGGDFRTNSFGVTAYGSFTPLQGFFTDVVLGYAYKNYDVTRAVSAVAVPSGTIAALGRASGSTDSNNFDARMNLGYDFAIDNITIGPRAGVRYGYTLIHSFSESGPTGLELNYLDDEGVTSLQTSLGAAASIAISTELGVFVPQISFEWVHEFRNDQRFASVQLVDDGSGTTFISPTDKPDRDFFDLGVGVVAVMPGGVQPYVSFRALLGHSFFENYAGTFGARIEF